MIKAMALANAMETMTTPADITLQAMDTLRAITASIEQALVGRRVRVTSDHNGQPFGRSRRSWRGEICTIKSIHVDVYHGVQLSLEGHEWQCLIPADQVEFA